MQRCSRPGLSRWERTSPAAMPTPCLRSSKGTGGWWPCSSPVAGNRRRDGGAHGPQNYPLRPLRPAVLQGRRQHRQGRRRGVRIAPCRRSGERLMTMRFCVQTLLFLSLFMPGAVLLAADMTLWDVAGKAEISLEQAAGEFPSPGIVYVGEFHDNAAHHAGQLAVIQSPGQTQTPHSRGPGNVSTHRAEHPRRLGCQSAERGGDASSLCPQLESGLAFVPGTSSFIAETGASLWSA
jgi:hypothetical protein